MEIRVDGNRSTSDSWLRSRNVPLQELPPINEEEQRVAEKLAISLEDYRRSKYASDLTKTELQLRAFKVGQIVEAWLRNNEFRAETKSVWLKTFDGKYRIDVDVNGTLQSVVLEEDLMDDILDTGSREAGRGFDRAMAANFGACEVAQAS